MSGAVQRHHNSIAAFQGTLLDQLGDLGEDLEEFNRPTVDVDELFKTCLVEKQVLSHQCALLHEQLQSAGSATEMLLSSIRPSVLNSFDCARNEEYMAFKERLWNVSHTSDTPMPTLLANQDEDNSEYSITAQTQTLFCQITKLQFTDPVKSTRCGHCYERSAIDELLRGSRNIPCPIGGCRQHVAKSDLVTDVGLAKRLKLKKRVF